MPTSHHPSTEPYNWHPAVHALHFGETLYFVLIRLREPLHLPVAEQLHDLMSRAGVKYTCEYSLFGWWDGLVRAWLTPVSYERLGRVLDDSVNNVEDYRGFTTSQVWYLWTKEQKNMLTHDRDVQAVITGHAEDINVCAKIPDNPDEEVWSRLWSAGLVFARHHEGNDSVKFYTTLERTATRLSTEEEEIEVIMEAMRDSGMTDRSSLYLGNGPLAHYLIRSVSPNYSDVLAVVEKLDVNLKSTKLRPMTLLIANTNARESDHINDLASLSFLDNNSLDLLDIADPEILSNLSVQARAALHDLIVKACKIPPQESAVSEKLLAVLRASATNSHETLQEATSFLLAFEHFVKKYIVVELAGYFDPNWHAVLKRRCSEDKKWQGHTTQLDEPVDKWTLGTFVFSAMAASDFDQTFAGRLALQLGTDWKRQTDELVHLRNTIAHGQVYEFDRLDVFDEELATFLDRVIRAGAFWGLCVVAANGISN